MIRIHTGQRITALILLFTLGVYTHGALSHLGRHHTVTGSSPASSGREILLTAAPRECPWEMAPTVFTGVPEVVFGSVDRLPEHPLPPVSVPWSPPDRISPDSRAPPRLS
ncbi:MAG: hypothetical protein D6762_02485 [Candidatus Neomarinimicrobiota bacterium]|nr:MAG: hypothetical protein D6762_02485 [Candidatus Neomarinimicrobiota bacterium]